MRFLQFLQGALNNMKKVFALLITFIMIIVFCACEQAPEADGSESNYQFESFDEIFKVWKDAQALHEIDFDTMQNDSYLTNLYTNKVHNIDEVIIPTVKIDNYKFYWGTIHSNYIRYKFFEYSPDTGEGIEDSGLVITTWRSDNSFYFTDQGNENQIFWENTMLDLENNSFHINYNGREIHITFPDDIVPQTPQEANAMFEWTRYTLEDLEEMTFETE